ncbi:MAG TPA: hypothetical protein VH277_17370 [Gemmatimonadaceae bacterium]|jgi:hypothetical protein|nr:hypothetical protein [Gemmatimonadaceae bacterium]
MPTRLGVLITHGMGEQTAGFAEAISADLAERLEKKGIAKGTVSFCPLFWADVLEPKERELLAVEADAGTLAWMTLRRFVIHNLADAVAYRRADDEAGAVYDLIHDAIRAKLRTSIPVIGDDTPVMLLAHSLGGAIMSDYLWERQKGAQPGESKLERLVNLVGIVTFGCNIPLFTLALPRVQPVLLPSLELSREYDALRPAIEWHNYYDPDDVLGWPLARIYGPRDDGLPGPTIVDHDVNVGGWKTSWNPMCHGDYWTDRNFTGPVADHIERIVKLLPAQAKFTGTH